MHVRIARKRDKKSGKLYIYHQLVRSVRTEKGPRHEVVLNLGRLELPPEKWPLVARRVALHLKGQAELFPCLDAATEERAQEYARRILAKQLREPGPVELLPRRFESVDIDSISSNGHRRLGAEHVLWETYQLLGLDKAFGKLGFTVRQQAVAALLIVGRGAHPGSERETHRWVRRHSALDELMGTDFTHVSANTLYQVGDRILEAKAFLERHLRARERNLFCLRETIILYDLTNTHFEGQAQRNAKARYGKSKQRRNDCPLLTLGLVLDGEGFAKASEVFAGNQAEAETLLDMVGCLEQASGTPPTQRATIVIDAGLSCEENLQKLREAGYHYIAVSRKRFDPVEQEALVVLREEKDNRVAAKLIRGDHEAVLYCHSSRREAKERSMRRRWEQRYEVELTRLAQGLNKKHHTKRYDKVLERLGRLRERYPGVARFYQVEVEQKNGMAMRLRWERVNPEGAEARFGGHYFLRTTHLDWDEEQIWSVYTLLTEVEDTFRTLKGEIGLRPGYHQTEPRNDAHILITVLAYHLVHAVRRRLKEHGLRHRWSTIRELLDTHQRLTTRLQGEDGKTHYVRYTADPEPDVRAIYRALGIDPKPLPKRRVAF